MTLEELEKKVLELEKRVQASEDMEAIKKLHREFVHRMNDPKTGDGSGTRNLDSFTEDAVINIWHHGIRRGKKEIEEQARNVLSKLTKTASDALIQPVITVDGDKASGYWSLFIFVPGVTIPSGKSLLKWEIGRLQAEYRKVDGEWKISYLKLTRPYPPLNDEK